MDSRRSPLTTLKARVTSKLPIMGSSIFTASQLKRIGAISRPVLEEVGRTAGLIIVTKSAELGFEKVKVLILPESQPEKKDPPLPESYPIHITADPVHFKADPVHFKVEVALEVKIQNPLAIAGGFAVAGACGAAAAWFMLNGMFGGGKQSGPNGSG